MEWLLVLLSEVCCHTTHRLRNTHTCVCVCEYTCTHTTCSIHPLPKALQLSFTVHVLRSRKQIWFSTFLFFLHVLLLELSLPPSICCIWTAAQDEKTPKQTWQYLAFFSSPLMICLCFAHRHVKSIIGGRMLDEWMEECALLEADMKERSWNPLVVLTMSIWVRANQLCVYLQHNGVPWERFIWLEI